MNNIPKNFNQRTKMFQKLVNPKDWLLLLAALIISSAVQAGDSTQTAARVGYYNRPAGQEGLFDKIKIDSINGEKLDFLKTIKVTGGARFFAVYRSMDEFYPDMVTPEKDLSFTSYPTVGQGVSNGGGAPLLDLELSAQPTSKFGVTVGYSLFHQFTGEPETAKAAALRSSLTFGGKLNTDYGLFKIEAGGGVIWTSMSPLTMSSIENRFDNFDRLPWDWYTNSWQKYNDFYSASVNLGGESYGNIAFQGIKFSGNGLPLGFNFLGMYGRNNQGLGASKAEGHFPSSMAAGRLENSVGSAVVGVNYFSQFGDIDNYSEIKDRHTIMTGDLQFNLSNGVKVYTEFGRGFFENPSVEGPQWGNALIVRGNFPSIVTKLPINAQLFNVGHNFVSNVSTALNSNINVPNQGYGSDLRYATTVFVNPMQEVGQVANNRRGLSLSTGKKIGRWKLELGYAVSQEIENLYDTITFQHRANTFSRSRFTPWIQDAGPYQRVKNQFRRSYEFISIDDETGLDADYKKSFTAIDLSINYKTRFLGRGIIFKNFTNYNSVQPNLALLPKAGDEAFLRLLYDQFATFYQLNKKVSIVLFYEFERNIANERTELSDYNRKPLDQYGDGFGFGFDYDFSSFSGIYFRHRWMYHDDVNFVKDKFQGQETTVELKVFF